MNLLNAFKVLTTINVVMSVVVKFVLPFSFAVCGLYHNVMFLKFQSVPMFCLVNDNYSSYDTCNRKGSEAKCANPKKLKSLFMKPQHI